MVRLKSSRALNPEEQEPQASPFYLSVLIQTLLTLLPPVKAS